MTKIKVLVVDDQKVFTHAAERFLALSERLCVLPSAHSAAEALSRVPVEAPDLVIMDVNMPLISGLEAIERLKKLEQAPRIVAISVEDHATTARSSGADEFILKAELGATLPSVVEQLFGPPTQLERSEREHGHE